MFVTYQPTLLENHIADIPFVVIDTETTGLNPDHDRVVEIAAVRYRDGYPFERLETFVDPGIPIPPEASAIHGITDATVRTAPYLAEVDERLREFVGDALVVAHNAPFDRAFLPLLGGDWACSYRFARHLWPDAPSHKNQLLRYWLDIDVPELQGFGAHRATGDALVTGAIFQRAITTYLDRAGHEAYITTEDLIAYIDSPVPVTAFNYGRKHRGARIADVPTGYLQWVAADAAADVDARAMNVDPDTLAAVQAELVSRAA